jgi:long-chain acyl-CoA synthetase
MTIDTRPFPETATADAGVSTLCSQFQDAVDRLRDQTAISSVDEPSESVTWGEYGDKVEQVAGLLARLGVAHGDCVALLLSTRRDFHWFDTGAVHLGACTFSIYNTAPPRFLDHVLSNSRARVLLTEKAYLEQARRVVDRLDHVIVVDAVPGEWGYHDLADVTRPDGYDFEARWRAVVPEDVATIIYTSGTTGVPKGVEITHSNLFHAVNLYMDQTGIPRGAHQLSFLPMAHMAARFMDHYSQILRDFRLSLVSSPAAVMAGLVAVRPSMFFSTPRTWEKLRANILAGIEAVADEEHRAELRGALARGLERVGTAGLGTPPDPADAPLLLELRAMVGLDGLVGAIVGGAPFQRELMEFYHALGIPLGESYGLSENTGCCATNPPSGIRFGTVGKPINGQEVCLAEDGEILIRGPLVMRGYRDMPEATAEALDADGWLHTGDIGAFDDEGYLKLVDRKKDLIINTAGKNMAPALIQGELVKAGRLVSTAVAVGDGRPYNTALLVLDPEALSVFCQENGIAEAPLAELAQHELVRAVLAEDVETANQSLSRIEQIKKFHVVTDEWEPGGEELTATMKLRRVGVTTRYAREIDALYTA